MTFADDAGEYSVFAKNQLGEVSASADLLEEGRNPSVRNACSEEEVREEEVLSSNAECFVSTEEYEALMKKQEAIFKTEVTAMVQEPTAGATPMEQTATITTGQVGAHL